MRPLVLLASAVVAGLFGSLAANPVPVPYHAYCRTVWLFAMPCVDVGAKLVQQIRALSPVHGCQKCHYTIRVSGMPLILLKMLALVSLVSATPDAIEAHHTSTDIQHVESIEFTLHPTTLPSSCHVSAQSSSLAFTSLFDGGLNYCNLHNLLTGSGLSLAPGFMEMTSEWACLGYGFATCRT